MADSKISALTAATAVTDDDLAIIVNDPAGTPVTNKITIANWRQTIMKLFLTARGDLLTRGAADVQRLAIGAANTWLKSDGTDVAWASPKVGEFFIPAGAMTPSTTSGCNAPVLVEATTNKQNHWLLDFVNAATKYAEYVAAMPSDYNGGTFTARFIWRCASAVSTVVRWQVEAISYGDLETIDAAFGTAVAVDDTYGGTANQNAISAATAAVTPAGTPAAGEVMHFRFARLGSHVNDTMTQDARLLGVYITYTRS